MYYLYILQSFSVDGNSLQPAAVTSALTNSGLSPRRDPGPAVPILTNLQIAHSPSAKLSACANLDTL
jgi:hypothetical protein